MHSSGSSFGTNTCSTGTGSRNTEPWLWRLLGGNQDRGPI